MCKPASGVFVKGHVAYWSKYGDSHEVIITEHGLCADGIRGTNVVRFEITPPGGDMTKPLSEWVYRLDDGMENCLPDWYDATEAEKSARAMLKEWAAQKLITGTVDKLGDGEYYVSGSAKIGNVSGSAKIENVSGSAKIENVSGSAKINYVYDSAKINYVYGSAKIGKAEGSTTIITYVKMDHGFMQSANCILVDRSGKDCKCYVGIQKKEKAKKV